MAKIIEVNGKKYRKLRKGEKIRKGDWQWTNTDPTLENFSECVGSDAFVGNKVGYGFLKNHQNFFWRPV